jgi:hypothetical protein
MPQFMGCKVSELQSLGGDFKQYETLSVSNGKLG